MTHSDLTGPGSNSTDPSGSGSVADADKPLDPAAQRLQQKMRRLVLISSLTMVLGLAAVFVAIIYRINRIDETATRDFVASLSVPAGQEVRSATLSDGKIVLLLRAGGSDSLAIFDAQSGEALGSVILEK